LALANAVAGFCLPSNLCAPGWILWSALAAQRCAFLLRRLSI